MSFRLIAICGYKRSGKDEIANYISSRYGYKHIKIADKLKKIVQILFDFEDVETSTKEETDKGWGVSPRQAMQFIGTDVMQYKIQELMPDIGRTFWISDLIKRGIINKTDKIVISDLRFLHEYQILKDYDPLIIRIVRPEIIQTDSHQSECEYMNIPCNVEITNDEGIEDLHEKINRILQHAE